MTSGSRRYIDVNELQVRQLMKGGADRKKMIRSLFAEGKAIRRRARLLLRSKGKRSAGGFFVDGEVERRLGWVLIKMPDIETLSLNESKIGGKAVQQWFKDASTRLDVPGAEACEKIAEALSDPLLFTFKKKNESPLDTEGQKAGRRYIISLSKYRRKLELRQAPQETLAAIDQLIEGVEVTLQPAKKHSQTWHKTVGPLAHLARWGWDTTGGAVPRDKGSLQPLCKWVVQALAALGWKADAATISDVLRRRYDRPRSKQQSRK